MNAKNARLNVSLLFLLLLAAPAFGEEPVPMPEVQVKKEEEVQRAQFGLLAGISHFGYGGSINSAGIGASFLYALSDSFGLKTSFEQNFNLSGFSALSSMADLRVEYALTGTLLSRKETYSVGGSRILADESIHAGGIRLEAQSDLGFFNSIGSVITFTGLGAGIGYEFPSRDSLRYEVGIRADFLSSSKVNIVPVQVSLGVLFP